MLRRQVQWACHHYPSVICEHAVILVRRLFVLMQKTQDIKLTSRTWAAKQAQALQTHWRASTKCCTWKVCSSRRHEAKSGLWCTGRLTAGLTRTEDVTLDWRAVLRRLAAGAMTKSSQDARSLTRTDVHVLLSLSSLRAPSVWCRTRSHFYDFQLFRPCFQCCISNRVSRCMCSVRC